MYTPHSPAKHRQLIALAIVVAISSTVLGCREKTAPATSAPAVVPAPTSKQAAIHKLMALPELKAWAAAIEKQSQGSTRGAVIEYDQAPRLIRGERYYQLSFVENGKDAVHRLEDFLVAEKDGTILVEDGNTDQAMTVEQWRNTKRPMDRLR